MPLMRHDILSDNQFAFTNRIICFLFKTDSGIIYPILLQLATRINTGFSIPLHHSNSFSCSLQVLFFVAFFLQNRIILIRFCLSFIWFQNWCTQIVPRYIFLNSCDVSQLLSDCSFIF